MYPHPMNFVPPPEPHPAPGLNLEPINQPINLTDPATLMRELKSNSEGLRQQVEAASGKTALGGHPYPNQLFEKSAITMDYAVGMIQHLLNLLAQPPAETKTDAKKTDAPSAGEKKPK